MAYGMRRVVRIIKFSADPLKLVTSGIPTSIHDAVPDLHSTRIATINRWRKQAEFYALTEIINQMTLTQAPTNLRRYHIPFSSAQHYAGGKNAAYNPPCTTAYIAISLTKTSTLLLLPKMLPKTPPPPP